MGRSGIFISIIIGLLGFGAFFYFSQGPTLTETPVPPASPAEEAVTLHYGINDAKNFNRLPQVIAEREGFFAREGLDVQIIHFTSSFREPVEGQDPRSLREAMADGSADMSRQQLPLMIHDAITGRSTGTYVGVAVTASNPVYFLAVGPEINSYDDLRGKTVAVTNLHDGITIWVQKLMALNGLQNEDVTLNIIAGSRARATCLVTGECDGAILAQPAIFEALDASFHSLGITNEIEPLQYMVDVVKPAWAAANRDFVLKYIRATTAAMRFIEDPMNRDEVVRVTMEFMDEPEDHAREMLSYIWDPQNRVLPQQAAIDMNSVNEAIALLGEYGVLEEPWPSAESFIDPTYANEAEQ